MCTRILLADDHQLICSGLRKLLEQEPDFEVVAEARDGRSAVALATQLSPDVVVMDVSMPDLNGVEATRQIVGGGSSGGIKVIALSGHSDRRFVAQMLAAGAAGYLSKASAFAELVLAVQTVAAGRTYLSPAVTGGLVDDYVRGGTAAAGSSSAAATLSPREREVLQLLAEGKAMKQAAMQLHVSVKTVETHRRNLAGKLDLYSVAELTKYAIREGLTTVDA